MRGFFIACEGLGEQGVCLFGEACGDPDFSRVGRVFVWGGDNRGRVRELAI